MSATIDTLPDDPAQLKALLADSQKEKQAFEAEVKHLREQLNNVFEALRLERYRHYGTKSEKAPGQGELFDEADDDVESLPTEQDRFANTDSTETKSRKPPGGRKPLPADLPRIDQVHELPEAERECACGCTLHEIGEDISEELDIIPAKVQVIRHVRKKYACKSCEETIKSAPAPAVLLPKALASANTMAYVITAKYADGLPLYRLSHILQRHQVDLSRQTLSASVLATAQKLDPLMDVLESTLNNSPLIHMDETRVQVLKEPDKTPQSQSYMWVRRGGPPDRSVIRFTYDPGRSTAVPETLLADFRGVLMTDGYEPYRTVSAAYGLTHLCCMAHARRKFVEAQKAQPKGKTGRADKALAFMAKLYAVEKRCRGGDAALRHRTRQEISVPVLEDFHRWLADAQQKVPPKNALGKAVNYALKYWAELSRYTEDDSWPIDNNLAENAIRPFVIGRKNWLFSNSQKGAKASANLYSLIETSKANYQEPYRYLCWLFNKLPETSLENMESLAPWNMPIGQPGT